VLHVYGLIAPSTNNAHFIRFARSHSFVAVRNPLFSGRKLGVLTHAESLEFLASHLAKALPLLAAEQPEIDLDYGSSLFETFSYEPVGDSTVIYTKRSNDPNHIRADLFGNRKLNYFERNAFGRYFYRYMNLRTEPQAK